MHVFIMVYSRRPNIEHSLIINPISISSKEAYCTDPKYVNTPYGAMDISNTFVNLYFDINIYRAMI